LKFCHKCSRGLTLIEIMTASVILAMVLIPLFLMYSQTMDTISYTEDELKAFSIAQREIERLKSWNSIKKQSLEHLAIMTGSEGKKFPKIEKDSKFRYFRKIIPNVTLTANDVPAPLRNAKVGKISTTVFWVDKYGKDKSLTLRCFIEKKYY